MQAILATKVKTKKSAFPTEGLEQARVVLDLMGRARSPLSAEEIAATFIGSDQTIGEVRDVLQSLARLGHLRAPLREVGMGRDGRNLGKTTAVPIVVMRQREQHQALGWRQAAPPDLRERPISSRGRSCRGGLAHLPALRPDDELGALVAGKRRPDRKQVGEQLGLDGVPGPLARLRLDAYEEGRTGLAGPHKVEDRASDRGLLIGIQHVKVVVGMKHALVRFPLRPSFDSIGMVAVSALSRFSSGGRPSARRGS